MVLPIGVYPRVGGGNLENVREGMPENGLSPRGRGKPSLRAFEGLLRGSIPAWAGETHWQWRRLR